MNMLRIDDPDTVSRQAGRVAGEFEDWRAGFGCRDDDFVSRWFTACEARQRDRDQDEQKANGENLSSIPSYFLSFDRFVVQRRCISDA